MSFDPNTLPAAQRPEWATHIQGRSPKFKVHRNRGQALQAAAYYSRSCQIYRWDDDQDKWVVVWDGVVDDRSVSRGETCERCHKTTMVTRKYNRSLPGGSEKGERTLNLGSVGWLKSDTNKSKLVEPFTRAWLCRSCK